MADETKQLNNRKNATHVVPFAVLIAPTLLNVSTDNNAKANGISMKNCTHTVKLRTRNGAETYPSNDASPSNSFVYDVRMKPKRNKLYF